MVELDRGQGRFFTQALDWPRFFLFLLLVACAARPAQPPSKAGVSAASPPKTSQASGSVPASSVKACAPLTFAALSYDEQLARKKASYARSVSHGDYELSMGETEAILANTSIVFDHKNKSARAVRSPEASWVFEGFWQEHAVWLLICGGTLQAHDPATLQVLWRFGIEEGMRLSDLSIAPELLALKLAAYDAPCRFVVVRSGDGTVVWRSEAFQKPEICNSARLDLAGHAGLLTYRQETSPPRVPVDQVHEVFVNMLTGERWFEETSVARYGGMFRHFTTDLLLRLLEPLDKSTALAPGAKLLTAYSLSNGQRLWSQAVCSQATECNVQLDTFEGRQVVLHGDALGAELEVLDSATGTSQWSRSVPLTDLGAVHKAGTRWVFSAAAPCKTAECPPPSAYRVVDMTSGALLHESKIEPLADFATSSGSSALNGQRLAVVLPHAGAVSMEQRVALYTLGEKQPLWATPPSACLLGSDHQVLLEEQKLHVCSCDHVLRSYDLKTKRRLLRVGVEYCGDLTVENGALLYEGSQLAAQPWVNAARTVQIHGEICVDGTPDEYSGFLQIGDRRIRVPLGPFTVESTLPGYVTVQPVPSHTNLEWDTRAVGPLETEVDVGTICVGHFHP